jgi:uncharacterized membrane protein YagU involved in acid resistance
LAKTDWKWEIKDKGTPPRGKGKPTRTLSTPPLILGSKHSCEGIFMFKGEHLAEVPSVSHFAIHVLFSIVSCLVRRERSLVL